jgi:hypothetical protein
MATIPVPSGPRVAAGGGGQILTPAMPYQDAGIAGTPAGQGAAIGAGMEAFAQGLGAGGAEFGRQALQEQALTNEAMTRDGDSIAATKMGNIYNEYAALEGEKAVAAKDGYMAKMLEARKEALDTMPNPETKRMLDNVLTRRVGFYQESIGRYAATEQKKWQARSATGAAQVAQNQAGIFRNVPELVEVNIESGAGSIVQLGEIHGWDNATTQAEVAKYRGNAYQAVVSQLLADGKVDEAASMFDRVRDKIDASAQAQIAQALKPQLLKRQTQTDFATIMGTGPGTVTTMADAIEAQESGGRDGLVSVDGARGRMQITPGTFAMHAQPGERIDDPKDNRTVGRRIIAGYEARWANDPQRVAVAYFSGPGNVAEPGSPTPWKEDRRDGNGMTVSRYVQQVTARLRKDTEEAPAYERPDFAAAREKAVATWGEDPERLTRVMARIGQAETQYNSTTKADRDQLKARLIDTEAALSDGRAVAIPETQIRRLYPKEQADEIVGRLNEAQNMGYAMQAVALASPQEYAALLAGYDDVGRAGAQGDEETRPGYAQRAKLRETLVRAWQQRNEAIKRDPAVFAGRAPAVSALATPEALAAPGGAENYARATLGEQERLGVPEGDRRVLPKAAVEGLVQKVIEADPEKTPAALVLGELGKQYGAMWPDVFRDMVRSGLPEDYAILGSMSHPDQVGARGDAQRMLSFVATKGGAAALRVAVGDNTVAKSIDDAVDGVLAPFYATAREATRGPASRESMRSFVKNLAYYYAGKGVSASQALDYAVTGALKAKYDFDGTMRVPKGQMELAKDVTRGVQANLTEDQLAPVPEGPIAKEQRENLVRVAREGFWVPNADDTGLVLMGNYKVAETGIPMALPIKRASGERVEVRFDEMPAMRNAQRGAAGPSGARREDTAPMRTPAQNEERVRRGLAPL